MRYLVVLLWLLCCAVSPAFAQVSIGIGLPGVSIGINLPEYPDLVPVPGYPVYYAPRLNSNFFFYDSMYWVYEGDTWYASSWYNGPWGLVDPQAVPLFVLRIPVRYYRVPPAYFRGWRADAPPRWGQHWGNDWDQRHRGWDKWNRASAGTPAPLPLYQRKYSGDRYPGVEQQQSLRAQNYRYRPVDPEVRQHEQVRSAQGVPAAPLPPHAAPPQDRGSVTQERPRPAAPPMAGKDAAHGAPGQVAPERQNPTGRDHRSPAGPAQREPAARSAEQREAPQESKRNQGQDHDKGEGRNK